MKWSTKIQYIDQETGEVLTSRHIKTGLYIKEKTIKLKSKKYGTDHIEKHLRIICKRNNQLRIEL